MDLYLSCAGISSKEYIFAFLYKLKHLPLHVNKVSYTPAHG